MYKEMNQFYLTGLWETLDLAKPILIAQSSWTNRYLNQLYRKACATNGVVLHNSNLANDYKIIVFHEHELKTAIEYRRKRKKRTH